MEQDTAIDWNFVKLVFQYSIGFVFLAAILYVFREIDIAIGWKYCALILYVLAALKIFTQHNLIVFTGFCMMMFGLNFVYQDGTLPIIVKVLATIAVLMQFSKRA